MKYCPSVRPSLSFPQSCLVDYHTSERPAGINQDLIRSQRGEERRRKNMRRQSDLQVVQASNLWTVMAEQPPAIPYRRHHHVHSWAIIPLSEIVCLPFPRWDFGEFGGPRFCSTLLCNLSCEPNQTAFAKIKKKLRPSFVPPLHLE